MHSIFLRLICLQYVLEGDPQFVRAGNCFEEKREIDNVPSPLLSLTVERHAFLRTSPLRFTFKGWEMHRPPNTEATSPCAFRQDAAKIAGLTPVATITEPIAAAIAYGMPKDRDYDEKILVYGLGGGTFDVTLLMIDSGVYEVMCAAA